jgi:pSer/pThr/pTyr-binding forkhead associated (FHA) protein
MLRFGDSVLDRDARQLFRGGIQVHLPPKAIEDLGSKNGTLVGDQAVSAPTPIADGALRVGRVALVFRSEKDEGDTVTDNR